MAENGKTGVKRGAVATLRIPDPQRVAVKKLREMSDGKVKEIVAALQQKPFNVTDVEAVAAELRPVLPDVPPGDVEILADTLLFFYYVRANSDVTPEKFVSDISRAFRDFGGEKLTDEEFTSFKKRIEGLLAVESLAVSAKALSLQRDFENTFCEAKTLTDVRSVFGTNVEDKPVGFVLTHTLKIGYHDDGGRHREFFVALDEDDLSTLRDVVERAEKKAKSLRTAMGKTELRYLAAE